MTCENVVKTQEIATNNSVHHHEHKKKSIDAMSDVEIIQENLKEIQEKKSREERKANGRLVAVIVAFLVIFLAVYHACVRKSAALAGVLVPATIMVTYAAWVTYLASREKQRRHLFERHFEEVALKYKSAFEEAKHSTSQQTLLHFENELDSRYMNMEGKTSTEVVDVTAKNAEKKNRKHHHHKPHRKHHHKHSNRHSKRRREKKSDEENGEANDSASSVSLSTKPSCSHQALKKSCDISPSKPPSRDMPLLEDSDEIDTDSEAIKTANRKANISIQTRKTEFPPLAGLTFLQSDSHGGFILSRSKTS